MSRPASGRLRPWLGSAALHLILFGLIVQAALHWRSPPPMPQLALEGNVVRYQDLPPALKAGKPLREPAPPAPKPPAVEPEPEPVAKPDAAVEARQREEQLAATRLAAEQQRIAHDKLVADQQAKEAAADAERQRRADQAAAEQKRKAEAARQQQQEQAKLHEQQVQVEREARLKADLEAKARAKREAELKRALETEEAGEAIQRSGVMDEYRSLLVQTIERNWIRPPSAKAGLECTLYVTQATGGTVVDVRIGDCNGDQAVRESVANAVYRSSPLPAPRDLRAFERRLVIVFKPTE
jgi:colicin import membrane protein